MATTNRLTPRDSNAKERISARVSPEIYAVISKAAEFKGQTLNSFLVQSAFQQAQDDIAKHNLQWIKVTEEQADWLKLKLEEQTTINPYLQDALRLYQDLKHDSNRHRSILRFTKVRDH